MTQPRFLCDAMLGTLARWLRFAGFDTCYGAGQPDAALAGLARAEGRWLLTRDRELASTAGPRVVLLQGDDVAAQVRELSARLGLQADPGRFFSRCSACNGELAEVAREVAAQKVPPYVAAHAEQFRSCERCGRTYWRGSHVDRIRLRLEALFPREP